MPPRFFITHSHKDNDFVARLASDLRQAGFVGFLDIYSLKPGDLISLEISRGLEACDFYLPVLSYAALASPWCEIEIHTALTLRNTPDRRGRPRIIPILIEDCYKSMDAIMRALLHMRFYDDYDANLRALIQTVQSVSNVTQQPPLPLPKIEIPARITNKAGQEMLLIPAGEFLMGTSDVEARQVIQQYGKDWEKWVKDEQPQHTVYLDAFYISRYPVTNAEYKKFVDAAKRDVPFSKESWATVYNWDKQKRTYPADKANHPVVLVNWNDAVAYCNWLSEQTLDKETGKQVKFRLPTEAEWEKAASWDDAKKIKRVYPWEGAFNKNKCNTSESRIGGTTPVGKYSPLGDSMYGVGDMAGNVWEWCADWYDENFYKTAPRENPRNDSPSQYRSLRGGAWYSGSDFARCASRSRGHPDDLGNYVGFRCARSFS
ncbi:MAG: TIR domain-containing protein [Chloroflexota bacterium]|nr:MAG: TIR domain-containing protein [Chloroflexota bacterium]